MAGTRYESLNGLKAIAALGIVAMHVKANGDYALGEYAGKLVSSWTLFVYLFLILSGFGMFCGYYERFREGKCDLERFYARRYRKILPFFLTLILMDLALDHRPSQLIEGFTEATLVFGLLPNNQPSVIGVGWTLGVIFLFYLLFPFFVFLCHTRRRAVLSLMVAVALQYCCRSYYFTEKFVIASFIPRHSFLYCAPWFLFGGVLYLFREPLARFVSGIRWLWLADAVMLTMVFFAGVMPHIDPDDPGMLPLMLFAPWTIYAIAVDTPLLNNPLARFLSGMGLEIYLSHMLLFRVLEKARCLYLLGRGPASLALAWALIVLGVTVFVFLWRRAERLVSARLAKE